jgi:hypothetical protein
VRSNENPLLFRRERANTPVRIAGTRDWISKRKFVKPDSGMSPSRLHVETFFPADEAFESDPAFNGRSRRSVNV